MAQKNFKLVDIIPSLELTILCGNDKLDRLVRGGYSSDLLSDVMAHARPGDVWLTLQSHPNIIAVAVLKEIAAIILVNGRIPESETTEKATQEGVPILSTKLTSFEIAGKLYAMGLSGPHEC